MNPTFNSSGTLASKNTLMTKIVDRKGKVLRERYQDARQATSPEVAYLMTSMMERVIKHGTGSAVRVLARPAAGKTGTTNDYDDAWFMGYTPELVTGVWVGRDDHDPLGEGETGGKVAAPIWLEFMKEAMKDRPMTNFPIPPGVRFVRPDGRGNTLPAAASLADDAVLFEFEVFVDGNHPTTRVSSSPRKKLPPPPPRPRRLTSHLTLGAGIWTVSTGSRALRHHPTNHTRHIDCPHKILHGAIMLQTGSTS